MRYCLIIQILLIIRMTSVLYSSGLNYQAGNPLRTEIMGIRRELGELRKLIQDLSGENQVYRKYISRILCDSNEEVFDELNRDLSFLDSNSNRAQQAQAQQQTQQTSQRQMNPTISNNSAMRKGA